MAGVSLGLSQVRFEGFRVRLRFGFGLFCSQPTRNEQAVQIFAKCALHIGQNAITDCKNPGVWDVVAQGKEPTSRKVINGGGCGFPKYRLSPPISV